MNLTENIKSFNKGDIFTDEALLQFHNQLTELSASLSGTGDMFDLVESQVLYYETRVFDMLIARNLTY